MPTRHYRLRIRSAADDADALVLSSVATDTYPYLVGAPSGDGQSIDPATGSQSVGAYMVEAADPEVTDTIIDQTEYDDTFTEGADVNLNVHTPDAGFGGWEYNGAAADVKVESATGRAVFRVPGDRFVRSTSDVGEDGLDGYVDCLRGPVDGPSQAIGAYVLAESTVVAASIVGEGVCILWRRTSGSSGTIQIERRDATGATQQTAVLETLAPPNVNGGIRLEFVLDGLNLTVQRSDYGTGANPVALGTTVLTADLRDGNHARAGIIGNGDSSSGSSHWMRADNLHITVTTETPDTYRPVTRAVVDADGRQQLIQRRAYVELSTDGGSSWPTVLVAGYLNGYRLLNALRWVFTVVFTVGESRRIEQTRRIFERTTTRFDKATSLIGGPIHGGWGPFPDYNGWEFTVTAVGGDTVTLTFRSGWSATDYAASGVASYMFGTLSEVARERVNGLVKAEDRLRQDAVSGLDVYDGVTVEIGALDSTVIDRFTPVAQVADVPRPSNFQSHVILTYANTLIVLRAGTAWEASPPNVNDIVLVWAWRETISPDNPLHISAHPVDIWTDLRDDAGISYNAASAAAVKATLGANLRLDLRITSSTLLATFDELLYGLFGFNSRINASGERELFIARIRSLTPPAATYDLDDLRSPLSEGTFELDQGTIYNVVTVRQQRFFAWTPESGEAQPTDGIVAVERERSIELDSDGDGTPDAEVFGSRVLLFDLPGCVTLDVTGQMLGDVYFEQQVAAEIFDRFGRGGVFGTLEALPAITEVVGEELILNVPHLPNAGVRGGDRILQVVRRTEIPGGSVLRLLDSGPDAQFATSPTFTLAAGAADARKYVDVTITNQAALLTALAWLRIEWGIAAGQPTAGALLVTYQPADIPATLTLPVLDAGSHVWVRMQAFQPNRRPTAFTAWQNVDLTNLAAPSVLAETPDAGDDSLIVLSWTVGESDVPVELYLRPLGDPADEARLIAVKQPGSTGHTLRLTPGSSYTWGVRHREVAPFAGVSATTEKNYTVPGSSTQLPVPLDPQAFSVLNQGETNLIGDWTAAIGMRVTAAVVPSLVEFQMKVGAGAFGTVAILPSEPQGQTVFQFGVPEDYVERTFRARHTADGALDSDWTAELAVTAGIPQTVGTPVSQGGTGLSSFAVGDTLYASATTTLAKVAGNATTANKFWRQVGDGATPGAPSWQRITAADVDAGTFPALAAYSMSGLLTLTAGLTVSAGPVTFSKTGVNDGELYLRRDVGSYWNIWFQTGTSNRWRLSVNATAEGGANAGSDLEISRRADDGTHLGFPFAINRATGLVTLASGLSATTGVFSGLLTANLGLTVASGQTLTVTGATVTGLTAASVGAGTFPGDIGYAARRYGSLASPAQLTANQNDYSPTGEAVETWRLSTDASRTITGIANGASGRHLTIINVGSFELVLSNDDALSIAANRIDLFRAAGGTDLTLVPGAAATLWYDDTTTRWRLVSTQ
ncbi:MAG: hypothetical protein UY40_C0020G0006 [candidate division CPR1 bacterium GW2011_GWC1_49_13]|uniref:Uncharacterized protein n=1 Tax=candidate division CPR1 bacterium GW2011_GWC1_49_13 TaxID=1618342 RepID=A0A0G1YG99_9BACT|nr:MAG: hypothetical protein UY40_C0020G0006 [candidate division CPR1 bacterium GW2011_GWC1_49_13]